MEERTEPPDAEQPYHILELHQVFSRSLLWEMQRDYFASMGVEAWRQGDVPHYVTSNPTMANSYAEIVFAFLRDQERLTAVDEPLTIAELGAGSGRFAFHFLTRLRLLCEQANLPMTAFRFILTDFTQRNLDFWQAHPSFQPYFESGVLDCALFDATQSKTIRLQRCGETITPRSLRRPLVEIANYLFDTIPQDLLYFDDQRCMSASSRSVSNETHARSVSPICSQRLSIILIIARLPHHAIAKCICDG